MKGGLISQTLAASDDSGTGANASLFSAIASLPVVAEAVLKIDNVPTAYSIKVLCAGPDTAGFGNVGTLDYYDNDGNVLNPPRTTDSYNYYYSALCMGNEVIFVSCYSLAPFKYPTRARFEGYSIAGLYGGGTKYFKSLDDIRLYTFTNATVSASGGYLYMYYDVNWEQNYIAYSCDSYGNVTLDTGSSFTDSGVYSGVQFGRFEISAKTSNKNYFIHGYKTEAIFQEKWLSFCNTMSGGEITCQQKQ